MRLKLFCLILSYALLNSIRAEEPPPAAPPATMIKAEGPVVIDGALDEGFWKTAPVVRGDYVNSKQNLLSEEPRLSVKYAWDEHYLYIAYETFDKNVIAKASPIKEGPEKNQRPGCEIWSADPKEKVDVVEFFISFGDERFFWEIHHNAANQFNDVFCVLVDPAWPIAKSSLTNFGIMFNNREFINDDGEQTVAMAVKLKPKADGTPSTVNGSDDSDTGYKAEIRLPWGGLGAPTSAKPDAKKKETAWKVEGQNILLLAVVQDGDLKERYHHSSPTRKGDWFHKTVPLWPKYQLSKNAIEKKSTLLDFEKLNPAQFADEIFRRLDKGEPVGDLLQPAANHGMALAQACAAGLRADKPHRVNAIYDIIAVASRARRSHRELLRLYDPAAHEIFYTKAGEETQKQFAFALQSPEQWSNVVQESLVNAAPRPLLNWMSAQADSNNPDFAKLNLIWRQWGSVIFFSRERQHTPEVRSLIEKFARNEKLTSDPIALAALLRFAGEAGAIGMAATAAKQLSHPDAAVRAEACLALQRFGGERAAPELLKLAATEKDATVQLRIAEALGAWHEDAAAGAAASALFERCDTPEVRRAILFSAGEAEWPQRTALLVRSFQFPEHGVLGVALQGVASHPEEELRDKTLELMGAFKTAPAALIEALGGLKDPRAVPYLIDALKNSKNLSLRLKIILALEQIGGAEASSVLLAELKDTSNALFAQQLIAMAGRLKLKGAEDTLISLSEDLTAPLPVRIQALWSIGAFRSETVLAALKRIDARLDHYFGTPDASASDASSYEKIEQAGILVKMALLQQGDVSAADQAAALYARGTPTTKLSMLMLLAELKLDHAVIADGLRSPDFAVMLSAVHAASAVAPKKYRATLQALQDAPFIQGMIESGMDVNELDEVLEHALAAGK